MRTGLLRAGRSGQAVVRRPGIWALVAAVLALSPQSVCGDATVGAWGTVQSLTYRPVHATLLPTGKVWWWSGNNAQLWDPASGSVTNTAQVGYNIFCSAHSLTADGKVLVTGGHISNNHGLNDASCYDPFTNTWAQLPDMNGGRWYPTNVTLASGDVVVMSGDDENASRNLIPQVWQAASGSWRTLSGASLSLPLYPAAFLAPNGRVFVATSTSRYLETSGTGAWTTVATCRVAGRDNYGSACMYGGGQVIYTGGGDPPQASCEVIDLNATSPAWNLVAAMPQARRQHNVTLLPDSTLLVTGGSSSDGFNTDDGPKPAINWNPATNAWTTWAAESRYRGYHSEAVLLPDGRVASIGGDGQASLQVFSPPYLFKGARPTISSAPVSVAYGQTFFVETPNGASITNVNWVRPTSVTHTKNMDQRINHLNFTRVTGGLNVTAPANANLAPPGYYMLFLLNDNSVPSVARFIRLVSTGNAAPTLAAIADRVVPSSQDIITVTLSATDPNGDPLTFAATAQSLAYVLDQQLGLFTDGNLYENYGGRGDKWMLGSGGLWYFILPNGELYRWDGSNQATGTLVGTPGASYHANPALLYNAQANQPHAAVSVAGTTLTIDRENGFGGGVVVTVTVSDGQATDSKTFTVTVTN